MPYLPEFRTLSHKKMTSCRSIHTAADAECWPHRCVHCRVRKQLPASQEKRVLLNFAEWLHAKHPKMHRRRMRDLS